MITNIKGLEVYEIPKSISFNTIKQDYPDGAVIWSKDSVVKQMIPYSEVFDENDNLKEAVFDDVCHFAECNIPHKYNCLVIYPIRKIDIPDVCNYNAFLCGDFNKEDEPGSFLSYCEKRANTVFDMYHKKYGVSSDELYFYFIEKFDSYKLGKASGGFGIVYLGTSVGKVDIYNIIKDYKNVPLSNKIYTISYKKLFEFYEIFNEEYDTYQRFDALCKIPESNSYAFLVDAMEKLEFDKALFFGNELTTDKQFVIEKFVNEFFSDIVEKDSLVVLEKYANYIVQGGKYSKYGNFGMFLITSESERTSSFVRHLQKLSVYLDTGDDEWSYEAFTESELFNQYRDYDSIYRRLEKGNIVHIKDCALAPVENSDAGTGSAYEEQLFRIDRYNRFWDDIRRFIHENPRRIVLISMNESVYKNTFCKKGELLNLLYEVTIKDYTCENILNFVIHNLKTNGFSITNEFIDGVTRYIETTYPSAVGNSEKYIEELTNKIVSLYYSKVHQCGEPIDIDCIPNHEIRSIDNILTDLNKLYGLTKVKKLFTNICSAKQYESKISDNSINSRYHMVFTGNPGTGKTTVARLVADMYYALGIIKSNVLIEKRASDMISHWTGGTPNKVRTIIEEAKNGVLFIDEAYGFVNLKSGNDDKGQQALECLMQAIDTESIVVILAGYQDEMDELFDMNQGLKSRIRYNVHFDDYNIDDLVEILVGKLKDHGYTIEDNAMPILVDYVKGKMAEPDFGNARGVESLCQRLDEKYKVLVERKGYIDDRCLREKHFKSVMPPVRETHIEDLVGIEAIKDKLHSLKKTAIYRKQAIKNGLELPPMSMHMVFTGNPGTGKTTAAKLFAQELYNAGVIETNKTVMIEPKDLNGNSKEDGVTIFKKKLREAKGGILFIDEAYALTNKGTVSGMKIVEELLTAMIDYKDDIIFIFAGYEEDMSKFMDSNPGLKSRIGNKIFFPDYEPDELLEIFRRKCSMIGYSYDDQVLNKVESIIKYFHGIEDLGNARFVENLVSMVISKKAVNMYDDVLVNCNTESLGIIDIDDIPSVEEVFKSIPGNEKMVAPVKRSLEDSRRIIIHELGHAVASYHQYPYCSKPDLLVFSQNFMSAARVTYSNDIKLKTESVCKAELVNLLAGRNAEIILLGECSLGCSQDYYRAKKIADIMEKEAAMGELGVTTAGMFLIEAEKTATDILNIYKDFVIELTDKIVNKELDCLVNNEIAGADFELLIEEYKKNNPL